MLIWKNKGNFLYLLINFCFREVVGKVKQKMTFNFFIEALR